MLILHDPQCADYGSPARPEQPARAVNTREHLRAAHPDWTWQLPPPPASDDLLLLAHTPELLKRLEHGPDFDDETPYFDGIATHARRSVSAAIAATAAAIASRAPSFSLMRPPGHHATGSQAMGFCYFNQVAISALHAQKALGISRVAVWDFDAHHGNGTEAILLGRKGILFASVHQHSEFPPDSGEHSSGNCLNWSVPAQTPRSQLLATLRESLDTLLQFRPGLLLVSAGFDAYVRDPITDMTLEIEDFATLGRWLREASLPTAAILEGGYSDDLPLLVDAFLSAWEK